MTGSRCCTAVGQDPLAQSIATMGRTDLFVSGWDINPNDVQICLSEVDRTPICLGRGAERAGSPPSPPAFSPRRPNPPARLLWPGESVFAAHNAIPAWLPTVDCSACQCRLRHAPGSEGGGGVRRGAGQFGSVYKAVRAGVQDCAVKLLHRTSAEDLSKFIEARFAQHRGFLFTACCAAWGAASANRALSRAAAGLQVCGMQRDCWAQNPQEVSILKSLNYDRNIVQFYGACMRSGQELMLVTEVVPSPTPVPRMAPSPTLQFSADAMYLLSRAVEAS